MLFVAIMSFRIAVFAQRPIQLIDHGKNQGGCFFGNSHELPAAKGYLEEEFAGADRYLDLVENETPSRVAT